MVRLRPDDALKYSTTKVGDPSVSYELDHLTSMPVIGVELIANNAVRKLMDIAGPEDPAEAKDAAPNSLRAKFGENEWKNVLHCSRSNVEAIKVGKIYAHKLRALSPKNL